MIFWFLIIAGCVIAIGLLVWAWSSSNSEKIRAAASFRAPLRAVPRSTVTPISPYEPASTLHIAVCDNIPTTYVAAETPHVDAGLPAEAPSGFDGGGCDGGGGFDGGFGGCD